MSRSLRTPAVASILLSLAITSPALAQVQAAKSPTGTITVLAFPNDEGMESVGLDEVLTMIEIPATVHANGDDTFSVAIDPGDVPDDAYSDSGVVNLQVQRLVSGSDTEFGVSNFSLLRSPVDPEEWLDTSQSEVANGVATKSTTSARAVSRLGQSGFRSIDVSLDTQPLVGEASKGEARALADDPEDGGEVDPPGNDTGAWDQTVPIKDDQPSADGAASCRLNATATIPVTIGTSYPTGANDSWLEYSSSLTTKTGVAITFGTSDSAVYHREGTKTTDDNWGQDFAKANFDRSYRIDVNYGRYLCTNIITGVKYWQVAPRHQTGGTSTYRLAASTRPNWGNCANVANGVWWRGSTTGRNYSLSYGVKISQLIGFNLSSEHGYSSGGRLSYQVTNGNKKMCGSNDVPSKASKIQEKFR